LYFPRKESNNRAKCSETGVFSVLAQQTAQEMAWFIQLTGIGDAECVRILYSKAFSFTSQSQHGYGIANGNSANCGEPENLSKVRRISPTLV